MTQTIQSGSCALLSETGKNFTISKGEEKDNINLQLTAFSNMNRLCEAINKLNNVMKKKSMEKITIFNSLNKLNEALSRLDNAVNYYTAKR
jgi:hypothetical protein